MTTLKLYFSFPKMIKLSVMSILILMIGRYCLKSDIFAVQMMGILEIILGLATLFVALKGLLNKHPQLVLSETGILDNRILKKEIPWDQIEKTELKFVTNQKVLKLYVSNKFKNENFKWLYTKTAVVRLKSNTKEVLINLDSLKCDFDVLSDFLISKDINFGQTDLFKKLTGWNKFLNKTLY
ncbi:MAG TPA: STM3941 family protein [Flavobacterium sp.]|uniref:STM3941 family protein n=1 Tax=Flavobacterium sp. TaxID=239 RepID=UPI002BF787F8|nr:STM3941 family protein [Flavobacterium sp.]HSD14764.1 STM3941 family protein [Flavobacterium sp.]